MSKEKILEEFDKDWGEMSYTIRRTIISYDKK